MVMSMGYGILLLNLIAIIALVNNINALVPGTYLVTLIATITFGVRDFMRRENNVKLA